MALASLLNKYCNSPDVVFRTIRDFLAARNGIEDFGPGGDAPGPGYEIIDESYASGDPADTTSGDWCVMRSHGEANSYPAYIRLSFGATQHGINIYLGWDTDAHVGFAGTSRTNIYHNGAGEVLLYIYADLDEIHIVIRPRGSSNWYWCPCGRIKPSMTFYDGTPARVAGAIEAGAEADVLLPFWPGWAAPGKKIYTWDEQSLHETTIAAASEASGVITLSPAHARSAGSWMAEDMLIYACAAHNVSHGAKNTLYGIPGRSASTAQQAIQTLLPSVPGYDAKYGRRYGCDVWIQAETQNLHGRMANARLTRYGTITPGEVWTDENGATWRLHAVYDGWRIAFLEGA